MEEVHNLPLIRVSDVVLQGLACKESVEHAIEHDDSCIVIALHRRGLVGEIGAFRIKRLHNRSKIRKVALASGAFPFAFATRQIERHSDQEGNPEALYLKRDSDRKKQRMEANEQKLTDWTQGQYVYTDGGVFENEPIGLAMALIDSLADAPKRNDPDRFFLFIAPGARKADADPFLNSTGNDHLSVAKGLISAIMGQSRFQDWITKAEHERIPKVLAVTSRDEVLLGDVFSAFAGFLEEKFRAYDYNVGRDSAQRKIGLLMQSTTSPLRHYQSAPHPLASADGHGAESGDHHPRRLATNGADGLAHSIVAVPPTGQGAHATWKGWKTRARSTGGAQSTAG